MFDFVAWLFELYVNLILFSLQIHKRVRNEKFQQQKKATTNHTYSSADVLAIIVDELFDFFAVLIYFDRFPSASLVQLKLNLTTWTKAE